MNVGRLSNPVGVTTWPCTALPGVRGVAANPGLWNATPSAYVPWAISFDYAISVHQLYDHLAARSIGMHRPVTSTSNGFYAEGVAFQSPGSPRMRRTLGLRGPHETETPTGFYKSALPAYRSFIHSQCGHERRAIVQPRWGNHMAVHRITRGTRRGREPRAMECNAFGVGTIGHIIRLRNIGPSSI